MQRIGKSSWNTQSVLVSAATAAVLAEMPLAQTSLWPCHVCVPLTLPYNLHSSFPTGKCARSLLQHQLHANGMCRLDGQSCCGKGFHRAPFHFKNAFLPAHLSCLTPLSIAFKCFPFVITPPTILKTIFWERWTYLLAHWPLAHWLLIQ